MPLKTGRYVPATGSESRLTLRVERLAQPTGAGDTLLVSGDLLRAGKLHSFLSTPKSGRPAVRELVENGKRVLEADVLIGPRNHRTGRRGTARVVFDDDREGRLRLRCPAQSVALDASLRIRWKDRYFRDLTVELDKISAAAFPGTTRQDGVDRSLARLFREAGFRTRIVKSQRRLGDQVDGWTAGELHQAMEDNRRDLGPWSSYVFLTSFAIDENGDEDRDTLGWMFDTAEQDLNFVPREASAVFDEAVRAYTRTAFGRLSANRYQRELIITTAHEIGHAFNLAHSFDKERADSNSVMNYPEEYDDGPDAYYAALEYSFDRPELTHLRHHSPVVVEPGRVGGEDFFETDTFRTAVSGNGGNTWSRHQERTRKDLALRLSLSASRLLPYEPLVVTVGLDRRAWRGRTVSARIGTQLSWETGKLKFALRPRGKGAWSILHAPIRKCRVKRTVQLRRGRPREITVELLLSREGEIFRRDGEYELCALLAVGHGDACTVLQSPPARLRVAAPTKAEEKELCELFRTTGLKRLLLMPGAAVSDVARGAAEELHARAPDRLPGQLATMALIEEARSYGLGRARAASKRFLDRGYVDACRDRIAAQDGAAGRFARRLRGLVRSGKDAYRKTGRSKG